MKVLAGILALVATGGVVAQTVKEIESKLSYQVGDAKIELLGVCRATEREATCWGPDGTSSVPNVEKMFKAAFETQNNSVPVVYGKKTRVAIFQFTNPAYGSTQPAITENLQPAGQNSTSFFNLQNNSGGGSSALRTSFRALVLTCDPVDKTAAVQTSISTPQPPSEQAPLSVGAVFHYLGVTYTVAKISEMPGTPLANPSTPYGNRIVGNRLWVIGLTTSQALGRDFGNEPGWLALDEAGLSIRSVDKSGRPVLGDPPNSPYQGFFPYGQNPEPAKPPTIFPAQIQASRSGTNYARDILLYTNIDPAKIKSMYLAGSIVQSLTITGIPLDPTP